MSLKLCSTETAPSSGVGQDTVLHSRWLENETAKILQGDSLEDLKRLFRFWPYQDDNLPGSILRNRLEVTLDTFLILLRMEAGHKEPFVNLDTDHKIQEILDRLWQRPPPPDLTWEWTPQDAVYKADIEIIAADIDKASHLQFRQIPFEDWVRHALGYTPASVERFFDQHDILRGQLSHFLSDVPEAFGKFSRVKEVDYILPYLIILPANCS